MKKLAFLVYDSRSGSTLLAAMLNRYEGISVSQESNFIANILESPVVDVTAESVSRLFETMCSEVQFNEMDMDLEVYRKSLFGKLPMSKIDFIKDLAKFYFNGRDPNATIGIVKGARQMYHITELTSKLENSVVIHVYRDGRAVYASKLKSSDIEGKRMEKNVVKAAIDWRNKLHLMLDNQQVYNVKYEDVLMKSDRVLTALVEELGLKGSELAITKNNAEYSNAIGNKQKHLHANVGLAPNPDIAHKWKSELSNFQIQVYETINFGLLQRLGYETMHGRANDSVLRRVHVRMYIYFCMWLLAWRKTKKAIFLLKDRKSLRRKIGEKIFEYKAMKKRREDGQR